MLGIGKTPVVCDAPHPSEAFDRYLDRLVEWRWKDQEVNEILTAAEIESRFAAEWVLVEDPQLRRAGFAGRTGGPNDG